MSGRGRGRATRGGRGRGRGSQGRGTTRATATSRNNIKTGATKELGSHIYDYGSKAAADQMKTTTEQIVLHAGSKFGEDISTEIRTRAKVIIPEVEIPEEAQKKHELLLAKENQQLIRSKAANLKAIEAIKQALEKPDADPMLGVKIADLENAVDQIDHQMQNPKPLVLAKSMAIQAREYQIVLLARHREVELPTGHTNLRYTNKRISHFRNVFEVRVRDAR